MKRSVIGVSVVLALALALGGAGWFYLNYRIGQVTKIKGVKHLVKEKPGQPINILLVGSDSRAFVGTNSSLVQALGNPSIQTGQRSDVIIILRLVPATKGLEMLSIPRDTFVPIAGTTGENRINAAFNYGPSQLIQTIEQDFHISINHFAYADFPGFTDAVQSLGGVYLNFPDRVKDIVTGLNIKKTGCQLVNGQESLQLVRSRDLQYFAGGQWNYDGLGDLSRIRRQQAFFHAVIDRADSDWNIISLNSFIENAVKDVAVDSGFSTSELRNLAFEYRGVASAALHTNVLPTSGAVYNSADILLPVPRLDTPMIRAFLAFGAAKAKKGGPTTSTSSTSSTTTTTTSLAVTGTTTVPIVDNSKNYPEPWNPVPCSP